MYALQKGMADNLARFKLHTGVTTSCREQRMNAPAKLARPPQKKSKEESE